MSQHHHHHDYPHPPSGDNERRVFWAMLLTGGFMGVEAGGTMLLVAVLGLIVNIVALWLLHGGDRSNLNLRGATAHVWGDLIGSRAA